jgi:hypothetical protein
MLRDSLALEPSRNPNIALAGKLCNENIFVAENTKIRLFAPTQCAMNHRRLLLGDQQVVIIFCEFSAEIAFFIAPRSLLVGFIRNKEIKLLIKLDFVVSRASSLELLAGTVNYKMLFCQTLTETPK